MTHLDPSALAVVRWRERRWIIAAAICLVGVVALLWPLPPPGRLGWRPLLQDWCHVPVFAIMTAAMLLARWTLERPFSRAALGTFSLMTALAVGTELLQTFTGRSPDFDDLLMDLVGTCVGISAVTAFAARGRGTNIGFGVLTAVLLLLSADRLFTRGWAIWHKVAAFPVVEDFEHRGAWSLWSVEHDGAPGVLRSLTKAEAAGMALLMGVERHGITSLHHDACGQEWSRGTALILECDSTLSAPVQLGIRIDSADDPSQRLQLGATLASGASEIRVPLPESTVLRSVGQLVLFTDEPGDTGLVTLDNIRLSTEH